MTRAAAAELPTCVCGGAGWRYVGEAYIAHHAPDPTPTGDTSPEAVALYERKVRDAELRRAAVRESVYPCKECNTAAFYRWAGGHLDTHHDRGACPECADLAPRHRGHHHAPPPARRDPRPEPGPAPAPIAEPPGPEQSDLF